MNEILEEIKELKNIMAVQGKQITELTHTIKAYQKKELNVLESAAYLGVSKNTIHNLVSIGKLGGFKKGKKRYFTIKELEEYLSGFRS